MENYTRVEAMDKIEELEERLGKIRLFLDNAKQEPKRWIRNIDGSDTISAIYHHLDCQCVDVKPLIVDGKEYDVSRYLYFD